MSSHVTFLYAPSGFDASVEPDRGFLLQDDGSLLVSDAASLGPSASRWPSALPVPWSGVLKGDRLRRMDEAHFDCVVREEVELPDPIDLILQAGSYQQAGSVRARSVVEFARTRKRDLLTRSLAWQLGVSDMRYAIDGVLAALEGVAAVRFRSSSSDRPGWLDDEVERDLRSLDPVDDLLFDLAGRGALGHEATNGH